MSTVTARPISGPEAWQGSDLAKTTDWIRPIPAAAIDEIDRALRAIKARGLAWHDIRREEVPPRVQPRSRRGRPRARARPRGGAAARASGRALPGRRTAPGVLGHRLSPRHCPLPERSRRADRRRARRAARLRPGEPARRRAEARRAGDVALQGAVERAAALSHRPRRRRRAALRAPGATG